MTPQVFNPARPRGYIHARDKLAERYGLHISPEEHLRLSRMVAENDLRAVPVAHLSKGRMMVAFFMGGENGGQGDWVPAVWSPTSETIVTFRFPERLDRYRGMLARLDPETGKARGCECQAQATDPRAVELSRPPLNPHETVGRIIQRGTGIIPPEWKYKPWEKPSAKPKSSCPVRSIPDEAAELQSRWAEPFGPIPADPAEAKPYHQSLMDEIDRIRAMRDSAEFASELRAASAERAAWYKAAGRRMLALFEQCQKSRLVFKHPRNPKRRSPEVWWSDYAEVGRAAGCGPTLDPDAIMPAIVAAFKSMGERLGWQMTEQETAAKQLAERWIVRARKWPPPAFIEVDREDSAERAGESNIEVDSEDSGS